MSETDRYPPSRSPKPPTPTPEAKVGEKPLASAQPMPAAVAPQQQAPMARVVAAGPLAKAAPLAAPVAVPVAMVRPVAVAPVAVVQPVSAPAPQEQPLFAVASTATRKTARQAKRKSNFLPIALCSFCAVILIGGGIGLAFIMQQKPGEVAKALQKKTAKTSAAGETPAPTSIASRPSEQPAAIAASIPVAAKGEPTKATAADKSTGPDFVFRPLETTAPTAGDAPAPATPTSPTPAPATPTPPMPAVPAPTTPDSAKPTAENAPAVPPVTGLDAAVLELYNAKKLLVKKDYPALRKVFADRFADQHGEAIRQGLGADYDDTMKWFAEHVDIKEELFIAIDPAADKIPAVVTLFNELRKQYPAKIVPYANLAIATALVWDDDRRGVYDYSHHAKRAKAIEPTEVAAAADNFKYLIDTEQFMQGRIQFVPWEFLVFVVNHRTPLAERGWAMQNYLGKRVMFGSCYKDVPYDYEMLKSESASAKLNDKPYTLPNLVQFGGVCAMQADFASRVGKSIGVPAAYVRGQAADSEHHAWVMWVELKQATPTGLVFTLESHGRYRGDKYYVGSLDDPHTGKPITDRDMELRLQTVGLDTIAKRQTALVMQAYPALCENAQLDTAARLALLNQIIAASPGNEQAWTAAAQLARENAGDKKLAKAFTLLLDKLFVTFARVPDFTWRVFGDFAAFQEDPKQKVKLYERLVLLYEVAGRPDLGCEARLVLTDMLVEQNRHGEAVEGLAMTIKKFPEEGRYVPKMLDKIDQVCASLQDTDTALIQFYTEFLPLIPQMRMDTPSKYCMATFERAIALFRAKNQPQLAAFAEVELANMKAGKGRQPQMR